MIFSSFKKKRPVINTNDGTEIICECCNHVLGFVNTFKVFICYIGLHLFVKTKLIKMVR